MTPQFNDVMLDLETLGSSAGCAILSIGAVLFSTERHALGATFYQVINSRSCMSAGLRTDADTLEWWEKQKPEARTVLDLAFRSPSMLENALTAFNAFLGAHCNNNVRVWGNGASFDQPIIGAAYRAVHLKPAWQFYNERCYRTIKALAPQIKLTRVGTFHNAVDDAISQAEHLMLIQRALNLAI